MPSLKALHPHNWSLFVRTQVLVALLVVLLIAGFALVMAGVQQLVERNRDQIGLVDQQNATLERQNSVIQAQKAQLEQQQVALEEQLEALAIQRQTAVALQIYPEFLFWRFASTASQSDTDIAEGDRVEESLRDAVAELAELDAELAEAIDVFLLDLEDFNAIIERSVTQFRLGNVEEGRRIVQSSQATFISMNTMMEVVSQLASEAVVGANESVSTSLAALETSVDDVEQAAAGVTAVSTELIGGIEAVLERAGTTRTRGWITLAVVCLLFLVVGYILSRSVSRPVFELQQAIRRIDETADLSQRVHLKRRDEVGLIAKSFNGMLSSFGAIIRDVRAGAERMAEQVGENGRANEEVGRILDELNAEVEQVAAAINELSTTVGGINESTTEAAERAHQAEAECRHGAERSRASGDQEARLQTEIQAASDKLHQLADRAGNINAVVDVIQGVSEQTNLLALNAAIEAARAGEAGRGFAVVADEVRALAHQTEQSSAEIKSMIDQFASEVSTTVEAMQQAVESARSAGELSAEASAAMDGVLTMVSEIRATNEHISRATQEQTEATGSIDTSVTSIATLIARVADQAQQTVTGVREMATQSDRLKQQAERFTV